MRPLAIRIGLLLLAALLSDTALHAGELRNFGDAALHAIQMVENGDEGWAVGDEGVIWHTIDGGANWERQPSGVRASLRSLYFFNPYVGWIAGREELPGGGSNGVLLYTRDGGCRWERVLLNALPGLNRICFADSKTGYLAGDATDAHPTGVFITSDSGQHWKAVPGPRCSSWLAGDCGPDGAALAGTWNRLATVRHDRVFTVNMDALGGRNLRGLQLRGNSGVAVGQGGLVLLKSGGRDGQDTVWKVPLLLPPELQAGWDFHAVHGTGQHIWAVGRPGSVALHSPDLGAHWQIVKTGQPLPLNGLFFLDERRGWAVGELGSILATSDGGRTWQVQHRGGERAAVLLLSARARALPLDTVAALGGAQGYLTAAVCVTSPDRQTAAPARAADILRLPFAFRQAGGASAETLWQLPFGSHLTHLPAEELVKKWDEMHGDAAADLLLRQMVLALRVWRPSVVITDPEKATGDVLPCDALVSEAVREAFRRAGDDKAYPEQLTSSGLAPWKPAKLYAHGAANGTIVLDLTQPRNELGASLQEFASGPAGLLAEGAVSLPTERRFRLLASNLDGADTHQDLMQGIFLGQGGLARRPAAPRPELTPEEKRAIQQRGSLRALSEAPAGPLNRPERLLAQIGSTLAAMPDDQAAPAAYAVACQYARTGQWALASEAYRLLVARYPAHPLAAEGYRWLIRYYASSETRRRHEEQQRVILGSQSLGVMQQGKTQNPETPRPSDNALPSGFESKEKPPQHKLPAIAAMAEQQSNQVFLVDNKAETQQWYQRCLELEPKLAGFGSLFVRDPSVQFCVQAARRSLGQYDLAQKWYAQFAAQQPPGPWRDAALAELWLVNHAGAPPRPLCSCTFAETRPYLDGRLDDACWQDHPGVRLRDSIDERLTGVPGRETASGLPATVARVDGGTARDYPTEVRLAYDADHLYLAVRCQHPPGRQVPAARVRRRDANLDGFDRISLLLDLDRDYSTCFHLQIDQRGCVREDCWGDRTWDPRWFVAVHSEATEWVLEAAIPLRALTGDKVAFGRTWAVNVVRVLPGRGVQAFSLPAEAPEQALRPEGMGLLQFAPGTRESAPRGLSLTMPPANGSR